MLLVLFMILSFDVALPDLEYPQRLRADDIFASGVGYVEGTAGDGAYPSPARPEPPEVEVTTVIHLPVLVKIIVLVVAAGLIAWLFSNKGDV